MYGTKNPSVLSEIYDNISNVSLFIRCQACWEKGKMHTVNQSKFYSFVERETFSFPFCEHPIHQENNSNVLSDRNFTVGENF